MIEVRNLSRYYGNFAAISDLSFSIKENEVIGFLGLNGAGKSTTLKILAGLLSPSQGEIFIDSMNWVENPDAFRSKIGFLPEEPPLYKEMTVREFLHFTASLRKYPKNLISQRITDVVQICQLEDRVDQIIGELSLGYRKRVGIAQAIIHKPALVILDEPTSGLDPHQMVELRTVIKTLSQESTVLLSSHNLTEVAETCDRLLILNQGFLIASGDRDSLSQQISISSRKVEAIVGNTPTLKDTLSRLSSVKDVAIEPLEDHSKLILSITSDIPELVNELVANHIDIYRITQAQSELESIFLALTGEQA